MSDMSRVLDILRLLFPHVQTLEEFADSVVFREGQKAVLVEPSDSSQFVVFVRRAFVCRDKTLQQLPSNNEICTLPELLAFVLNNLRRKKRRNVLTHGYGCPHLSLDGFSADQFKFQWEVTQSAAYLNGSDLWKKVAQRLGTDVMRHLLESCSVFVAVPPSCAFQLCGAPVYDRVSAVTHVTSGFSLQKGSGKTPSVGRGRQRAGFVTHSRSCNAGIRVFSKETRMKKKGKRKREDDFIEDEEGLLCSGKRRRTGVGQEAEGTSRVRGDAQDGERRRWTGPPENLPEDDASDSVRTANVVTAPALTHPLEASPSWRTGAFPPPPTSQCFIRTLGMMYNGRGMQGFLLNRKKRGGAEEPRKLQGQDLVRIVFFEGVDSLKGVTRTPKRLPRRFFNAAPLFSQLLRQHRRCPYGRILRRTCPVVVEGEGQGDMSTLLAQHSSHHRVYLFIRECLSVVVPQQLWGSDHNRLNFLARIRGFLRSGKFDKLSLAELMWKMKVNDCDWVKISKAGRVPPSELSYRTQLLGQFLAWLLDGYALGLIRASFYVTESMGQKNALSFYRQEVWVKLQELAFRRHLSKCQLAELSPEQVASLPKTTITSRLRFIPKADGMRPITRVVGAKAKTRTFQARVRDLLDVLRVCARATPSVLGSTVWGTTDIHRVLSTLAPAQKDNPRPLYFVKVDVSGAFDSLPHTKLSEVIGQVLLPVTKKVFVVRQYAKIWIDAHEGLKKAFLREATFLEDNIGYTNMKGFVMSLQKEGKVHDAILVEQFSSTDLQGKDALELFTKMLTGIVIQVGKRKFHQWCGVPQGWAVSSLLCCLCYGHMENVLFKNITNKGGCLMRLVDDFLLITPDLSQAETFLKTLLPGVPEYGVVVNPQKVAVNFPLPPQSDAPGVRVLPPSCLFPWCGLLLNTNTLDVANDYSSYAGLSLRYTLTLGFSHSAGQQMRRKLMAILRLKCHALFLDLKINSVEAVYRNIYNLVLLQALRFHVCAQSLPFKQKVAKNPAYFLKMIRDMATYTNHLIRQRNKGMSLGSREQEGVLQYEAVELLFCLCFLLVLSPHRSMYRALLPVLHKRKRSLERCLGDLRLARVRQASIPRIPEAFMDIQA